MYFYLMYYTYILYSEKLDKYYIGSTNDIERRLERHNQGHTPYTRIGIPWKLFYSEVYNTRKEAFVREQQIKKMKSRTYIESLLGKGHPGEG